MGYRQVGLKTKRNNEDEASGLDKSSQGLDTRGLGKGNLT